MSAKTKNNLLELALQATRKNVTTRKSRKSINDYLFEMLYEGKELLTKVEIISRIALSRLEDSFEGELTADVFQSDEVQEQFKKITKTVKNGFEAAICNGSTSASFSANKRFADYQIVKNEKSQYSITEKSKK